MLESTAPSNANTACAFVNVGMRNEVRSSAPTPLALSLTWACKMESKASSHAERLAIGNIGTQIDNELAAKRLQAKCLEPF
ncbi:MAG: hypothetical protein ACOYD7_06040 [Raoultibacter sp.]